MYSNKQKDCTASHLRWCWRFVQFKVKRFGVFVGFFNRCGTRQLFYFAISIDKTFCLNTELVSFIFSVILLYESASMVTLFLCPPPPLFYTRVPLFIPVFGSCGESCLSVTVLSDPVPALAEGEMMTVRDFPAIICGVSNSQGVMSSQPVWVSHLFLCLSSLYFVKGLTLLNQTFFLSFFLNKLI